jgi:hypothetical protein
MLLGVSPTTDSSRLFCRTMLPLAEGRYGVKRRAVRIVLNTNVHDAIQRDAVPCQAVIVGDARSGLLLRERGNGRAKVPIKTAAYHPSLKSLAPVDPGLNAGE